MHFLIIFLFVLSASLPADHANTPTIASFQNQKDIDTVLFLMQKRLTIMHEVARAKWNKKLPIVDLERENQLLTDLVKKGQAYGLPDEWTLKFFQAQFDAAKQMQTADFEAWKKNGVTSFEHTLDLKNSIRPYLDELTQELIEALTKVYSLLMTEKYSSFTLVQPFSNRKSEQIDPSVWLTAITPLLS